MTRSHVLAIGSGMSAVAGALYVFYVQQVFANDFIPLTTFIAVTMVILGGVSNHKGVLVGAILMTLLDLVTRPVFLAMFEINWRPPFDMNYVRYVAMGVIIVLILMFRPEGLVPERPVETAALRVARSGSGDMPQQVADKGDV
jgi:branched-chain amino acid transport system permease protein